MNIWICTSFGGNRTNNINYAKMAWYLCKSIEKTNKNNLIKIVIGSTDNHSQKLASLIAKNTKKAQSINIELSNNDIYTSKIEILISTLKLAEFGDGLVYMDCDAMVHSNKENILYDTLAANFKHKLTLITQLRFHRKNHDTKFRSWMVGLLVSKDTSNFLQTWKKETAIVKMSRQSPFTDQLGLYRTWLKLRKNELDCGSAYDSPICHFGSMKIGSKKESHGFCGFSQGYRTIIQQFPHPPF